MCNVLNSESIHSLEKLFKGFLRQILEKNNQNVVSALSEFSDEISSANLEFLNLKHVPECMFSLFHLQEINLSNNEINILPQKVIMWKVLKLIDLSRNKFDCFPTSMLSLTSLTYISLSNNGLQSIPSHFNSLHLLEELDLSNNLLTDISSISQCGSLEKLHVDHNKITNVPLDISNLIKLSYFDCRANRISCLPSSLSKLRFLEVLSCSNNPISSPPSTVVSRGLPHILAYLSARSDVTTPTSLSSPDIELSPDFALKNLDPETSKRYTCSSIPPNNKLNVLSSRRNSAYAELGVWKEEPQVVVSKLIPSSIPERSFNASSNPTQFPQCMEADYFQSSSRLNSSNSLSQLDGDFEQLTVENHIVENVELFHFSTHNSKEEKEKKLLESESPRPNVAPRSILITSFKNPANRKTVNSGQPVATLRQLDRSQSDNGITPCDLLPRLSDSPPPLPLRQVPKMPANKPKTNTKKIDSYNPISQDTSLLTSRLKKNINNGNEDYVSEYVPKTRPRLPQFQPKQIDTLCSNVNILPSTLADDCKADNLTIPSPNSTSVFRPQLPSRASSMAISATQVISSDVDVVLRKKMMNEFIARQNVCNSPRLPNTVDVVMTTNQGQSGSVISANVNEQPSYEAVHMSEYKKLWSNTSLELKQLLERFLNVYIPVEPAALSSVLSSGVHLAIFINNLFEHEVITNINYIEASKVASSNIQAKQNLVKCRKFVRQVGVPKLLNC